MEGLALAEKVILRRRTEDGHHTCETQQKINDAPTTTVFRSASRAFVAGMVRKRSAGAREPKKDANAAPLSRLA